MNTMLQRNPQARPILKVSKVLVGIGFMLSGKNAWATGEPTVLNPTSSASVAVPPSDPKLASFESKGFLPSGIDVPEGLGLSLAQRWQADKTTSPRNLTSLQKPVAPFAYTRISSDFGVRRDPLVGTWRQHRGIDLPGAIGTPIYATNDGWVTQSGYSSGYGLLVRIDHGQSLESLYGHLSGVAVNINSPIFRGTLIGYLGSTGRSTGAHLHFEVRQFGRALDPLTYLATETYNYQIPAPVFASQPAHVSEYAKRRLTQQPAQAGLPGSF